MNFGWDTLYVPTVPTFSQCKLNKKLWLLNFSYEKKYVIAMKSANSKTHSCEKEAWVCEKMYSLLPFTYFVN